MMGNLSRKLYIFLVLLHLHVSSSKILPRPHKTRNAQNLAPDQPFIFTAVSPKVIRPGSPYPLILSLERAEDVVDFDIKIRTCPPEQNDWGQPSKRKANYTIETVAKKQLSLEPGTTKEVFVELDGALTHEIYNVTVKGTSKRGKSSEDFGLAYVRRQNHSVVIQTDKPVYKPSEAVQFRVLFLDRFFKPYKFDPILTQTTIQVLDAQGNIIKSWIGKDIRIQKKYGFVKETFQLSKEPNLGEWRIEVTSKGNQEDGESKETHSFGVDKYVLPKFKVEAKAIPSYITYNQSKFNVEVKSTYTHGKGVKGKCSVTLKRQYDYYIEPDNVPNKRPRSVVRTKEVDGKEMFEFNLRADIRVEENDASDYGNEFMIEVICFEEATGKNMTTHANIRLYRYPWKIEMVNQPSTYKPGFPLSLTVKVSTHDGTPVADENPEALKIRHGFAYNVEESVVFKPIPPNGLVSFVFHPPTNDLIYVNGMEATYKEFVQHLGVPSRHISPTNSYMELTLLNGEDSKSIERPTLFVGQVVTILVRVNKPFSALNWILSGRSSVLKADRIKLNEPLQEYKLEVELIPGSDPHANLLVYSVLSPDDDIISENIKLDVNHNEEKTLCIEVKGYSSLNKTVEPGNDVTIAWKNPGTGSLVALRGVDQSVLLLKEDKDVDMKRVKDLENFWENGMSMFRSWGGSDSFQTFQGIYMNIITNAFLTKQEHIYYRYNRYRGRVRHGGVMRMQNRFSKVPMAMPMMAMADMAESAPAPMMMAKSSARGFSANMAGAGGAAGGGGGLPPPEIRMRTSFPETWIFHEFNDEGGKNEFTTTVPDTITSWIISAFKVNPEDGLGVLKSPTTLTVFRPFFISLNLPYSVIRGEVFLLKVLIHNYMDHAVQAKVTLENKDSTFVLAKEEEEQYEKTTQDIPSNSVGVVSFLISPTKVGTLSLSLKAVSVGNEAGDGLTQPLIVKPPGVKHVKSDSVFVNLKNSGKSTKKSLTPVFPQDRVVDGDLLTVTVIGDVLGGALHHLDRLIQLPHGCGEQNMVHFVPDIVTLDYLKDVDELTPFMKNRAVNFLEIGYQRQLTFKRFDGSYSAFGNSDPDGSTWLTALVIRSFISAKRFISIDETALISGLDFLVNQQNDDGAFVEMGYIHDRVLQGGGGKNRVSLTAYVLLAVLEAKNHPGLLKHVEGKNYTAVLESGVKYILKYENDIYDSYTILLSTYLLHLLDHPKKDSFFKKVEDRAVTDTKGGYKFWEVRPEHSRKHPHWHGFGRGPIMMFDIYSDPRYHDSVKPAAVEMTAYALLIYLQRDEEGELKESLPIVKWLVKQRNCWGGFISTQDTVVGITALAALAKKTYYRDTELTVTISHAGGPSTDLAVGKDNRTTLQEYFPAADAQSVDITAEGKGSALAQLTWTYYTLNTGNKTGFELEHVFTPKDKNRTLHHKLCAAYTGSNGKSNMAILEVNAPTGYVFDQEDADKMKQGSQLVKRVELEEADARLNVYFDRLVEEKTCLTITAHRIYLVAKIAKASIALYDYYDTTKKITKLYDAPVVSVCQICHLDESCESSNCPVSL